MYIEAAKQILLQGLVFHDEVNTIGSRCDALISLWLKDISRAFVWEGKSSKSACESVTMVHPL